LPQALLSRWSIAALARASDSRTAQIPFPPREGTIETPSVTRNTDDAVIADLRVCRAPAIEVLGGS
jgi:hypothetical protein